VWHVGGALHSNSKGYTAVEEKIGSLRISGQSKLIAAVHTQHRFAVTHGHSN